MSDNRSGICVISLESKRNLSFDNVSNICSQLAGCGYYADRICRVAFDNSDEIVRAINDAKATYENLIVSCPATMDGTVKNYLCSLYGAKFDAIGALNCDNFSVFVFNYDAPNRLTFADVKARLDEKYSINYEKTYIRACAPKDVLDKAISKALSEIKANGIDAVINVKCDFGDCRIEVLYSSKTPKIIFDNIVRGIVEALGEYVYALEDISLAEQLYRLLTLRRLKISIAESFTGGGVGKSLVEVPGVSEVYFEGLNTYSNEAKMSRLGVSEMTLKQHGAVSAETAYEMAEGLIKTGNCQLSISTTGIAGPKSDNTAKPVGLAYIGIGLGEDIAVYKFNFKGDREAISRTAVNQALFLAYKRIK
ncbi:MAG: CinA family protein [Candidatus Coproplasma sp.]